MDKPEQRPEGQLIAAALKRSKLSARKASQLAGMSDGRWGQIVRGYQTMGDDVYAPVRAPADTLARMAHVVGVTPEQLDQAGRGDAAEELRELLAGHAVPAGDADRTLAELTEMVRQDPELGRAILEAFRVALRRRDEPNEGKDRGRTDERDVG